MIININKIKVAERIRKDNGDTKQLADSIREIGLLNPITVMEEGDEYVLMAGYRRLQAMKSLGWHETDATVLSMMEADEQLRIEIEENEMRKNFTVSERLAYAAKIKVIEQQKARQRMSEHARDGHKEAQGCLQRDTPEKEGHTKKIRTDDIVAEKAGFSSRHQLERATYVAEKRPDILEQIDAGEKTITGAFNEIKAREEKPTEQAVPPKAKELEGLAVNDEQKDHRRIENQPVDKRTQDVLDSLNKELTPLVDRLWNVERKYRQCKHDEQTDRILSERVDAILSVAIDSLRAFYTGKYKEAYEMGHTILRVDTK